MKVLWWINFVLLTLNSFSTAIVKLLQLEFEMELFRRAGMTDPLTIGFGVIQLIGAILLVLMIFMVYKKSVYKGGNDKKIQNAEFEVELN